MASLISFVSDIFRSWCGSSSWSINFLCTEFGPSCSLQAVTGNHGGLDVLVLIFLASESHRCFDLGETDPSTEGENSAELGGFQIMLLL